MLYYAYAFHAHFTAEWSSHSQTYYEYDKFMLTCGVIWWRFWVIFGIKFYFAMSRDKEWKKWIFKHNIFESLFFPFFFAYLRSKFRCILISYPRMKCLNRMIFLEKCNEVAYFLLLIIDSRITHEVIKKIVVFEE